MSNAAMHRENVRQAKEDIKRMPAEAEAILQSSEPGCRGLTEPFGHMERAGRPGFHHGCEFAFKQHGAEEVQPAKETPA